jgi:hypothetical protein
MVWGAISVHGTSKMQILEGSINQIMVQETQYYIIGLGQFIVKKQHYNIILILVT